MRTSAPPATLAPVAAASRCMSDGLQTQTPVCAVLNGLAGVQAESEGTVTRGKLSEQHALLDKVLQPGVSGCGR